MRTHETRLVMELNYCIGKLANDDNGIGPFNYKITVRQPAGFGCPPVNEY
jgi:hypothetical protein